MNFDENAPNFAVVLSRCVKQCTFICLSLLWLTLLHNIPYMSPYVCTSIDRRKSTTTNRTDLKCNQHNLDHTSLSVSIDGYLLASICSTHVNKFLKNQFCLLIINCCFSYQSTKHPHMISMPARKGLFTSCTVKYGGQCKTYFLHVTLKPVQ